MQSRQTLHEEMETIKIIMNGLSGGLTLVLAFIGVMNFVNVMVSGTRNCRRELMMRESIGMTKKQMKRMLLTEGAYYTVISLGLLWTLGTALGYILVALFQQKASYAVYSFPALPLALLSAVVIAISLITPLVTYNRFAKESITDRLRVE